MTRCFRILGGVLLGTAWLLGPAQSQPGGPMTNAAVTAATTNIPTAAGAPKADAIAGRFAVTCSGCHSLAGVKLNGPDLTPAMGWPMDQLKTAIKRMEKNVGPLTDEQVSALAEFMKAPDIRERIKAEQERIQSQFLAKMAPPDPVVGRSLFLGNEPLRNGGLACSACHAAAGVGGNLGKDLTGVFARMGGQAPLVSAIEQSAFKIMAPHYKRHPVTKQEAMHLAKYFSTLDANAPPAAQAAFVPVGGGLALALMVAVVFHFHRLRLRSRRDTRLARRRS